MGGRQTSPGSSDGRPTTLTNAPPTGWNEVHGLIPRTVDKRPQRRRFSTVSTVRDVKRPRAPDSTGSGPHSQQGQRPLFLDHRCRRATGMWPAQQSEASPGRTGSRCQPDSVASPASWAPPAAGLRSAMAFGMIASGRNRRLAPLPRYRHLAEYSPNGRTPSSPTLALRTAGPGILRDGDSRTRPWLRLSGRGAGEAAEGSLPYFSGEFVSGLPLDPCVRRAVKPSTASHVCVKVQALGINDPSPVK